MSRRSVLVLHAPGTELSALLIRATMLCAANVGIYVVVARAVGKSELSRCVA
jgi:hypothetical protein